MRFSSPLIPGRLLRRYKRFLADLRLDTGEEITAHCANPGAMLGLATPGARALLSISEKPGRKLKHSWELVEADFGAGPQWVGVNTGHPNAIVAEALAANLIPELAGFNEMRREVKYGRNSRIDIRLDYPDAPPCYVEIKNVHMMRTPGLAEFPDSVTARGAKHLEELGDMVEMGARAMMIYLIQMQAERFTLAADIDPKYAAAFARARQRGVEAIAIKCTVTPTGIEVDGRAPIEI